MEFYKSKEEELTRFAAEVLTWELPLEMTQDKLDQVKSLASAAITHTHDVLKIKLNRIVIKPRISINDLARFNRQVRESKIP